MKPLQTIFLWSLVLLPIAVFFYFLIGFYAQVPVWDDFFAIYDFAFRFNEAQNVFSKFILLFSQHNEHRILFDRVLTAVQISTTGSINLLLFVVLGNSMLFALLFLLYKNAATRLQLIHLAMGALLFYQPQYYENSFWAMAALQNNSALLCIFCALYFLTKSDSNSNLFFACLLGAIATFSSGSGMFVWIAGLLYLVFSKNYKRLIPFGLMAATCIILYFTNYSVKASPLSQAMPGVWKTMLFFFRLCGASTELDLVHPMLTTLAGLLILVFTGYLFFFKKYHMLNPANFYFLIALFGIMAAGAVSRAYTYDTGFILSRYKIYSVLILLQTVFAFFEVFEIKSRKILFGMLAACLCFNLACAVLYYPKAMYYSRNSRVGLYNWLNNKTGLEFPEQIVSTALLNRCMEAGYFRFPSGFLEDEKPLFDKVLITIPDTSVLLNVSFKKNDFLEKQIIVKGTVESKSLSGIRAERRYLLLKSESENFIGEINDNKFGSAANPFSRYVNADIPFETTISARSVQPGFYKAYYCLLDAENNVYVFACGKRAYEIEYEKR